MSPSTGIFQAQVVRKGTSSGIWLIIFLILCWKKNLDEKFYVHESWELLMSLHSENVHDQAYYVAREYYY